VDFSIEKLLEEDAENTKQGFPTRIATLIETGLNVENSGNWVSLPGGEKIWQLRIHAKDAVAIMLYYKKFYIPEGGKLFIYNAEKTHVLGAYTDITNKKGNEFATEFVAGDDIILEYVAASDGEKPLIEISEIGYGYNHISVYSNPETKATSGSCMVNINCSPEGDDWQDQKKGVCHTVQRIRGASYICTASLVNNTAEDFKPYILTAYHCMCNNNGYEAYDSEFAQWMFYFNMERVDCNNSSPVKKYKSMTGCTKIAYSPINGGSDGLLLLLNDDIPEDYDVYYNGWDRSNTSPQTSVCIHHPNGDYKKISTVTTPASIGTWDDWVNVGLYGAHWTVNFASTENGYGVTEGGSSGSPLFNPNKLITGTLSGGMSECSRASGPDYYGKLYYHWDKYGTDNNKRMDIWLDPLNTGTTNLSGKYRFEIKGAPANLSATYNNNIAQLIWEAPDVVPAPSSYKIYKNNVQRRVETTTSFTDNNVGSGHFTYSVIAVYPDNKESERVNTSILTGNYNEPISINAIVSADNKNVSVNWAEPKTLEQSIYWGTGTKRSFMSFPSRSSFYFGHGWNSDEIRPFYNRLLTAVQFIPVAGATYRIYIVQGNRTYRQDLSNLIDDQVNTITLDTPFTIDNNYLIVSVYTSYSGTIYPAAYDNGPVIQGKGDLVSFDGKDWDKLYNYSEDGSYNYNFVVKAIVSSDNGGLSTDPDEGSPYIWTMPDGSFQYRSPAPFIDFIGYNLYRNDTKLNDTPLLVTNYDDTGIPDGQYIYKVSAVYGEEESVKISSEEVTVSGIGLSVQDEVNVIPTYFDNYVTIKNANRVNLVEIISADGKSVSKIKSPQDNIDTSNLDTGMYIFILHTDNDIKTFKGLKK